MLYTHACLRTTQNAKLFLFFDLRKFFNNLSSFCDVGRKGAFFTTLLQLIADLRTRKKSFFAEKILHCLHFWG